MVTSEINTFLSPSRPLVMAHRGDQTVSPENSLLALKNASLLEIDFIESDIRITKDHELILFHDDTLDRTTNASGRIIDYTLDELESEVDVGYHFTLDDGKTFPCRGKDWRVVTLRQAFQIFPSMRFNLDIKDSESEAPRLLADLITEFDREKSVLIGSFHHDQIVRFRKLLPHIPTAASPNEVKNFIIRHKIRMNRLISPKYLALQVPVNYNGTRIITPAFVSDAHKRNLAVHVWTINDRATMEWLIGLGVDGIFTDDPWLLLEALQEKELI
ncbi:MAG: glycerophosphodiester phosphodiesterase [Candidatus Hodarchaeales archaeon]|jgi:glycerophosphoryl diester phosphodiesterase